MGPAGGPGRVVPRGGYLGLGVDIIVTHHFWNHFSEGEMELSQVPFHGPCPRALDVSVPTVIAGQVIPITTVEQP